MKKLKNAVLFLFVASLALTSCSKDDDNNGPTTSGNIVGKWEFYKYGEKEGDNENLGPYDNDCATSKDFVEFTSDGAFITNIYEADCSLSTDVGTYIKSGNSLTTTDSFDTTNLTIKELSSSTLKVYNTYTEGGETYTDVNVLIRIN